MAVFLMSIKPKFGEEILKGLKKYELRRLVGPLVEPGDLLYLYFTKPAGAVIGRFTAGIVFLVPAGSISRLLGELGDVGIGAEDLEYVKGAKYAMLIQVKNPEACTAPVRLSDAGLRPPPSYRRLKGEGAEALSRLCVRS
ncbi:hypothetical protein [Pyrobaculum aerophilum]|nr:hypothetical protein [Pyrobaculum aerophilum]MCX8136586.1 hypothetical protein [Pyrobaculum aerophilum]